MSNINAYLCGMDKKKGNKKSRIAPSSKKPQLKSTRDKSIELSIYEAPSMSITDHIRNGGDILQETKKPPNYDQPMQNRIIDKFGRK